MIGLASLFAKLRTAALVLAALVASAVSVWLLGRRGGKEAQRQAEAARDAQASAQAAKDTIHANEVRSEVEAEVQKLPDAPPQRLSTADPSTSAGRLRTDGWLRDENGR